MGHRDFANPVAASGVRWLLVSLVLAAVADLVTDVPSYFGTAFPVLGALSGTASYERYSPILIVVVPTMVGVIGFGGILRIERGRGWTRDWRSEGARPALLAASIAAAFLFGSGLVLELFHVSTEDAWNPDRLPARSEAAAALATSRPPPPARPPESTTRATSTDCLEGLNR